MIVDTWVIVMLDDVCSGVECIKLCELLIMKLNYCLVMFVSIKLVRVRTVHDIMLLCSSLALTSSGLSSR